MKSFRQTTSFIERLRMILLVIAAFFVLGIMGLYFASRGFLHGLQEISNANQLLNLTGTSLQALQTSREHLIENKMTLTPNQVTSIRESNRLAVKHLRDSLRISFSDNKVREKFQGSLQSLELFQRSFEHISLVKPRDTFREEVLIAREYLSDAEDSLREAQILLKKDSDRIFSGIYADRFYPLIVAGILSSAFFGFVVIVGLANAKKLRAALGNLNQATDAVAEGDLTYQAPILENDEFGKLTYEFNKMVTFLREKQQRLTDAIGKVTRLQGITNSFSAALMPDEVFEIIVMDVHKALHADAGAISLVTEDGMEIDNKIIGYQTAPVRVNFDYRSPMTEVVKTGRPIFIDDIETLRESYPLVYQVVSRSQIVSLAYIPLIMGNQIYGALNFGFRIPRHFDAEERDFMIALTRQCAQALHRARLYKEATDAIHVRDEFLSIASHELRTPLTPLKLQLQNMSRQVKKGNFEVQNKDTVLKLVENSDRQVNRLITLIDDLLDVSRITAGKLTLNIEEFNFGDMVSEVVSQYSPEVKDAHSILTCEIDRTIICRADRVRMEQVVINLLTNALKYAPKKPIHVSLSRKGHMIHLEVADEGEGISPENQKRIFDRFERVRDRNNIGGLGLGLYICRQIVEAHHGHIGVISEPHHGATFTVEIPALS